MANHKEIRDVRYSSSSLTALYEDTAVSIIGDLHRGHFHNGWTFHGKVESGPPDWTGKAVTVWINGTTARLEIHPSV